MSRGVVPWWGRLLPYACIVAALGCFSWTLDIGGWRLTVFTAGAALLQLGHDIVHANAAADS